VVSFGGASSDFLLRNPNNERSGIAEIPVGSEVSLLEQGPGSPSYGSGIWYQVEVADPSNGAQILTGWLPKEVIERAEFNAEETVNCRPEPQGEFHDLWHLYQTRLGCPIHPSPIAGFFSEQLFEQGMMYWSQIADLYVARIGEPESIWYMVRPQEITNFDPNGPGCLVSNDDPNDGRQVPVRGIGSIWCERTEIQQGLGMALERERGVNGDAIQGFERGLILRDSTGAIFVFFSDDQSYLNVPPN
jgi:hypothetical protein